MRHIAISGELGSGKSTLAQMLAAHLRIPVVRSGDVLRAIARQMGISTLDANLLAEAESVIDDQIDGALKAIATKGPASILDSRMAWHFVDTAIKVHLIVDPAVAARRLSIGRTSVVENYSSTEQAYVDAEARHQSEVRRFRDKYRVDISKLENYDLVIDTSDASPAEIFAAVASFLNAEDHSRRRLFLSPYRLIPRAMYHLYGKLAGQTCMSDSDPEDHRSQLSVVYFRPHMIAVDGYGALRAALASCKPLVPAVLATPPASFETPADWIQRVAMSGKACGRCAEYWRVRYGANLAPPTAPEFGNDAFGITKAP
jgi:CMP/dCMP kinase